jgi:hypothetical protein
MGEPEVMTMNMRDRLTKLEAEAARQSPNVAPWSFPSALQPSSREHGDHMATIGTVILEEGRWGDLSALPEVAAMLHGELTHAQVARIAELAQPYLSEESITLKENSRQMWDKIVRDNEARGCYGLSS